jgi:hypothetical protein
VRVGQHLGDVNKGKLDFYVDEAPDGSFLLRTDNDGNQKVKLKTGPFPGDGPFDLIACEKNSTTVCSNTITADFTGVPIDLSEPEDEPGDEQDEYPDGGKTAGKGADVPVTFAFRGNYPNPFNPETRLQFDLPERAEVSVGVYDMLGREVLSVSSQVMEAGSSQSVLIDGSQLSSGAYLYRLRVEMASGVEIATGRMLLVK